MKNSAILFFTGYSKDVILKEGGTHSWRLNTKIAKCAKYAVLCYNPNMMLDVPGATGQELIGRHEPYEHGAAYLIGKISHLVKSPTIPERLMVQFDEYAEVNLPNTWGGWQNPVKYSTLEEVGINISDLEFKKMPDKPISQSSPHIAEIGTKQGNQGLTIQGAKKGLAATYGVPPEAIEINIRG